jgi:hypothetical protein
MARVRGGFAEVAPLPFFVIARLVRAIQFHSSAGKKWITWTSRVMTTADKSGFCKTPAFAGHDKGGMGFPYGMRIVVPVFARESRVISQTALEQKWGAISIERHGAKTGRMAQFSTVW